MLDQTTRVTGTLDPVTGVVILDITETGVTMNAAVLVLDLPQPVTVTPGPVTNVLRGFMEGSAQFSVMSTVLDQRTHVESMESVIRAVILGITEPTVQIFVAQAVVGQTTPVTLTLEIAIVVTQDTQAEPVATVSVCQD